MKRNIMKTLALAIAMMLLLGCLFACDSGETQPSPDDKPATTTKPHHPQMMLRMMRRKIRGPIVLH